jgi:hypothetical protein
MQMLEGQKFQEKTEKSNKQFTFIIKIYQEHNLVIFFFNDKFVRNYH